VKSSLSEPERTIMTSRESVFYWGCWVKLLFTLGLYFLWWLAKTVRVTNKRIIVKSGVFNTKEISVPINRVTDIFVTRGLIGRFLGYGNVQIQSAGSPHAEVVAQNVSNPEGVKNTIVRQTN